jgi:glutamate racemase
MNKQPIGIFDSGVGGLTIMHSLMNFLPNETFIYLADSKNAPYGEKSRDKIIELSVKNTQFLLSHNCKLIIVACNTATGIAIDYLRDTFNKIPFVGLEPAIKPACLKTQTNNIGVLATEGTLKGRHFKETSNKYQDYVKIHAQAGYFLAQKVEDNTYNDREAQQLLEKYIRPMLSFNIDYLVLGCTHYPFYIDMIKKITGDKVIILDSGEAVSRRTKDILMTNKILNTTQHHTETLFYTTGFTEIIEPLIHSFLGFSPNNYKLSQFEIKNV